MPKNAPHYVASKSFVLCSTCDTANILNLKICTMKMPAFAKKNTALSPWVQLVETTVHVESPDAQPQKQVYHSLQQADYINIVCVLEDGRIPLVRQFRPAIGDFTYELPGGIHDRESSAASIARAELMEETGIAVSGELEFLGTLIPDTGRLENKAHVFFVNGASLLQSWKEEPGVERILVTKEQLLDWVLQGKFTHAIHVAALFLADKKRKIFNV